MFLISVFTALLLHVTCVASKQCPTLAQTGPCMCRDRFPGLVVFCNGSQVDEIGDALENVANTKQPISHMNFDGVWLPHLPPKFLLGHDVFWITVRNCSTSSVDEDAFSDVAANLKTLFLIHNALERVPSQALKKCFNLTSLNLDNNRIEILHAEAFLGLDSLVYLSLHRNRIKLIDNSAFVGIGKQFENLDLDGNELTAVPCLPLRNQKSLKELDLRNNKIGSLLPEELGAMGSESLERLNLSNNTIRHLPASAFRSMKRLQRLLLSRNSIDSIHASAFQGIEDTLESLSLDYNRLEEVPSAELKNMRVLTSIDLSNNKICKIRKDDFSAYGRNLEDINLLHNSLEYVDTNAFIELQSLVDLKLGYNQLKTFPFETFAPVIDRLIWFDIQGNPLHCDCHLSWMKGRGLWNLHKLQSTKCVTPQEYAEVSLTEIAIDQLVCDNKTSNSPEPCCNCFSSTQESVTNIVQESVINSTRESISSSTQESVSINILMPILQLSFTYLLSTVLTKWLF